MKKFIKIALTFASCTTLSSMIPGCSIMKKNGSAADSGIQRTENIYKKLQVQKPDSLISRSDDVYLTGSAFKIEKQIILPPVFSQSITYTTVANESLVTTLHQIGKMVKKNIRLTPEASAVISKTKDTSTEIKSYQGTLSTVLDQITTKAGLFWNYQSGEIKIFSVETKVYALDAPIGDFNLKNSISSSTSTSGTGSADSATNGSSTVSMDSATAAESPWKSAITTIKSMLSPVGRLDTNPVEGYVTVTDNPERQREIQSYIKKINDKTNKKIAIRVDVYDVQTNNNSQYGLDMNAVTDALNGSVNWVSSSGTAMQSSGDAASTLTFTSGSHQVVLSALNTVGKTTQTTGTTIYTISGQPAPIQNSTQQNYLRSISTTTSDNDTTVSLDPGTITTGYSMTITPRISSDNQILIALNLQISTLVKMDTFSSSPSTDSSSTSSTSQQIQLPTVHTKSFLENMILKSGQTILIAGFQDDLVSSTTNSMGEEQYWALGGSKGTNRTKSTTVVVVTPYIIG